jgi:hypothetical protein
VTTRAIQLTVYNQNRLVALTAHINRLVALGWAKRFHAQVSVTTKAEAAN